MKLRYCQPLFLCLALIAQASQAAEPPPAEVVVLATLHQLHDEIPGYPPRALSRAIETLAPDVLCVEVRADHLLARMPEKTKLEYPAVIYPLIDRHHYRVYALEPSEPTFSALVRPYLAANQAFAESAPARAEALASYNKGVYAGLRAYWTSPGRVNDAVTDAVLRGKHALQQAMIGPGERAGWQAWNQHFLEVVTQAAAENPGKRIVVTVGAEHGYWLRAHLARSPGLRLLDTAKLLDDANDMEDSSPSVYPDASSNAGRARTRHAQASHFAAGAGSSDG